MPVMQSLFLSREFARAARRGGVTDDSLCEAVDRAEAGNIDADLGGGLIKQRLARPGKGRSGGFRTIIAYRKGGRAIFLHLFAKNRKSNLTRVEFEDLKDIAKPLMRLSDEQLRKLAAARGWREVERNDDEEDLSQ
jgi:hypothetical protein